MKAFSQRTPVLWFGGESCQVPSGSAKAAIGNNSYCDEDHEENGE